MFPEAKKKARCLSESGDLEDPSGGSSELFVALARQIQGLVHDHVDHLLGPSQMANAG